MATNGWLAQVSDFATHSPVIAVLHLIAAVTMIRVLQAIARVIYNLFFHPLRDFPGPRLAAAFELYHRSFYLRGEFLYQEVYLHRRYGPIVRIGPNTLSFTDPQAWKDIYGHRTGGKLATIKPISIPPRFEGHEMLEFIPSEEEHGQRRRLYAHAFSDRAIRQQEPILQDHVHKLVSKIGERRSKSPNSPIDLVAFLHFTTFDIMSDLAFGSGMGMLDNEMYNPWVAAIVGSMKAITILYIAQRYQPFKFLIAATPLGGYLKKAIDQHRAFAAEKVDQRLAQDVDRPDIWGLVINAGPEKMPSKWAMHEDGMLFMQAGTDTTSTLLSGLIFYLLKNPGKFDMLKREIRGAFKTQDDIVQAKLPHLQYMSACIEEGLRIHPPAPTSMERKAPAGGLTVCGHYLPEGTQVGIPHYAAYHDPRNFALPDEFHPERWLPDESSDTRFAQDKKDVLQPFLYGPRNCLGKNLAYNEMRLILASIILNFDLELDEKSETWARHKAYGLWQKPPLWVKLTSRL